jgi:hypothetical protein
MASTLAWFQSSGDLPQIRVYSAPVDQEEALHRSVVDACQTIHNYSGMSERMKRHVEACIDSHGGYFELLLYTLSAITLKLKVSGQVLIRRFFLLVWCVELWTQNFSVPLSYSCI